MDFYNGTRSNPVGTGVDVIAALPEDPTEDPPALESFAAATTPPLQQEQGTRRRTRQTPRRTGFGRLVTLPVYEERIQSPDRCRCCGTPSRVEVPNKGHSGRYELDVIAPFRVPRALKSGIPSTSIASGNVPAAIKLTRNQDAVQSIRSGMPA